MACDSQNQKMQMKYTAVLESEAGVYIDQAPAACDTARFTSKFNTANTKHLCHIFNDTNGVR